ncbi:MAG: MATE family efflux transporter [Clostridiales bacterium]|jgi:putative MATE family efflux protein|nr:MATE family efflux transporter [Clostridiales bacterium]
MSDNETTTNVQTIPAQDAAAIKGVSTTLDALEYGTIESMELEFKKDRRQRKKLPENITSRSLYNDIMGIAWPSLAELLLSSLVNMVDMMMVGSLGAGAIAAVGLVLQPRFLLMTTIMSLNTGATALIARARGAQNQERANNILRQSLVLATAISFVCAVFGTAFADWMVTFMAADGMEKETIELGVTYFKIQSITFMIPSWSFCITAALRGTGNAKPCMVYNIVANLVNIVGNWLLINGNLGFPKLGVAGASISTVIGQTVGTIMAFYSVASGKYYLKLKINLKTLFKFDKDIVSGMGKVGIPAMIEQLIMRTGLVIYSRTVATLGEISMATYQICMNIQSLTMMNGQSFAVSATSLIGQSLGKLRVDMAEHYGRRCRQLALYVSLFLALVFVIFREQLVMLYNKDPLIVSTGGIVMLIVAMLQPIQSSQFVLGGILRGAGDTKVTAFYVLITTVIIRTSLGYLFVTVLDYGLVGAWVAIAVDQIMRTMLFIFRYNQGKWKRIRL